jgi:hypothetical protein
MALSQARGSAIGHNRVDIIQVLLILKTLQMNPYTLALYTAVLLGIGSALGYIWAELSQLKKENDAKRDRIINSPGRVERYTINPEKFQEAQYRN